MGWPFALELVDVRCYLLEGYCLRPGQVWCGRSGDLGCLLEPRRRGDPTTGDPDRATWCLHISSSSMGGGLEGIPLGSLGPLPVTSRDDGGPVLAAAAPPVAGGNPFSLDMSASQAAMPPVPAYGAAAAPVGSHWQHQRQCRATTER